MRIVRTFVAVASAFMISSTIEAAPGQPAPAGQASSLSGRPAAILLEKGYGYADVKNKVPMDPHQTLMGVGSVSKLFTWLKHYTTAGSVPRSLEEYLSAIPAPKRIYPPGTLPAYSNYGANLAGYIVQRISGEPFSSYIEHHILNPLGMRRSTFRRPPPAGGFVSTADDMSRFMVAHLNDGRFENAQILAPETSQLMHLTSELIPGYA